jgi:GTP diphosphokinase / guanosine-3',5'-bis(diphosphate) 3'-diphosphatase
MPHNDAQKLIKKSSDPKLISNVFDFAKDAYKDKFRASGENYIYHALRVAYALDQMDLDPTTIAFSFLHDILDDIPESAKKIELQAIEKNFGKEIGQLVEKISELSKVRYSLKINIRDKKLFTREKTENLRRMFLAIAGDLRVVLVELVSRLDGLKLLHSLPEDQQKLYALETLQIFVPIANRLGLNKIRRELEDMSFSYLFPDRYKWLKENIKEQYEERERYLKKFIPHLKKIFKKERIRVLDINYRTKSYWSTYQKLAKHDMDFKRIHDLLALRIIVADIESCYKALGVVHKHFRPISEDINDYIAKPKPNGYRSLHTTIFSDKDKITEVQIRTEQMHKEAEYGVCAHWSYKEKIDLKKEGRDFEWMKDAPDFWKNFKIEFFTGQIFTLTPKGDVIVLKKGSTPVDFAYAIHSEIGNHCESAKINGKIATLSDTLKNGDIIEIVTNKKRMPSQDWLRFVKTSMAESQIRKAISQNKFSLKLPIPNFIKKRIIEIAETAKKKKEQKQQIKRVEVRHIYLGGQRGMLINIAKCCKPEPGDKVQAYLTRYRAAVLHRVSCKNFQELAKKFPDRIIDASWK